MAARMNPFNQQSVKEKIQATQLVKRLQNHAHGKIEMTPTQIDAAKFLLNKRLSNAPTQIEQELNGNINANVSFTVVGIEPQTRDSK